MSDARRRFEAWYASHAYPKTRARDWHIHGFRKIASGDEYWSGDVQEDWLLWSAGRADGVAETARRCAQVAGPEDSYQDEYFKAKADSVNRIKAEFPEAWK